MKLTKQNFETIAKIIRENTLHYPNQDKIDKGAFIQHLSDYFLVSNPNFDPYRFEKACKE